MALVFSLENGPERLESDMTRKARVPVAKGVRRHKIRTFRLGEGLPRPGDIRDELEDMRAVLLGHEDPPTTNGILTLMEIAEAYFSRACDLEQLILRAEAEGKIMKGRNSQYHSLRTQEIRSFKEMAKSAADLGSRRLSAENLRWEQETWGRESAG